MNNRITKLIVAACTIATLTLSACTKSHEAQGKQVGKKLDNIEKNVKDKFEDSKETAHEAKENAKKKARDLHEKSKEKAHELIDKA